MTEGRNKTSQAPIPIESVMATISAKFVAVSASVRVRGTEASVMKRSPPGRFTAKRPWEPSGTSGIPICKKRRDANGIALPSKTSPIFRPARSAGPPGSTPMIVCAMSIEKPNPENACQVSVTSDALLKSAKSVIARTATNRQIERPLVGRSIVIPSTPWEQGLD